MFLIVGVICLIVFSSFSIPFSYCNVKLGDSLCYNKKNHTVGCDEEHWEGTCNAPSRSRQSPIIFKPFNPGESVVDKSEMSLHKSSKITFNSAYDKTYKYRMIDNGAAIRIILEGADNLEVSGINGKTYKFQAMHIHWGLKREEGSEHRVTLKNGTIKSYSAEIHLVHTRSDFPSLDMAIKSGEGDALAVLGIFFQHSLNGLTAPAVDALMEGIYLLKHKKCKEWVSGDNLKINIRTLIPQKLSSGGFVFRYNGSLTTPPCSEEVIWTVYSVPLLIEDKKLAILQGIKCDGEPVGNNFRSIQAQPMETVVTHLEA